jgi:ethanolamine ammonia-lyase small subunit
MSDSWVALRRFTQARIALGRAGHAVPTPVLIDFQLAHAQARDAVQLPWDLTAFAGELRGLGEEVLVLETQVASREEYLRRPDLGRLLSDASRASLAAVGQGSAATGTAGKVPTKAKANTRFAQPSSAKAGAPDLALIVTNGLSSTALERHGIPLLREILERCRERGLKLAPISLVANGRVALLDQVGSALGARCAAIVVGERPGLSAADSLGIYLTFAPAPGNSDAQRNCISNIRPPEGLDYQSAAAKLLYLTEEALRRGVSGVALKDEMADLLSD